MHRTVPTVESVESDACLSSHDIWAHHIIRNDEGYEWQLGNDALDILEIQHFAVKVGASSSLLRSLRPERRVLRVSRLIVLLHQLEDVCVGVQFRLHIRLEVVGLNAQVGQWDVCAARNWIESRFTTSFGMFGSVPEEDNVSVLR